MAGILPFGAVFIELFFILTVTILNLSESTILYSLVTNSIEKKEI